MVYFGNLCPFDDAMGNLEMMKLGPPDDLMGNLGP